MVSRSRAKRFPWVLAPQGAAGAKARQRHSAARMAPSAVRIPDPRLSELVVRFSGMGPRIFVHEGARQALERRLSSALGRVVQLWVTDNRRRMVTRTETRGVLRVRAHMMFLDAPERVVAALVNFVVCDDRRASAILGEFIAANSHRIRASRPARGPLKPRGRVHDLYGVLSDVCDRYVGSAPPDVLITWGRQTQAGSDGRKSIKLGSYSASERLIRVHPVLDREWVPRYFLAYVVYHELMHHLVPAVNDGGRASLHSAEFLRREREFRHYERAMAWERKHIHRLLRSKCA